MGVTVTEAPHYIKYFTEQQFQDFIVADARQHGWLTYHTRDSRGSDPGFPDLVLVKPGRPVLFYEVKTEKGRVSMPQADWIDRINKTRGGAQAMIVRPDDWPYIAAELAA